MEQYEYALKLAKDELGAEHSLTESVGTTLKFARRAARKAARLNVMHQSSREADVGLLGAQSDSNESLKKDPSEFSSRRPSQRSAAGGPRYARGGAPAGPPASRSSAGIYGTVPTPPAPAEDATWSVSGGFARTKSSATMRSTAASKASLAPPRDATWSASTAGVGSSPLHTTAPGGGRDGSKTPAKPAPGSGTRHVSGSRQSRRVVQVVGSRF